MTFQYNISQKLKISRIYPLSALLIIMVVSAFAWLNLSQNAHAANGTAPEVTGIRLGLNGDTTRLVIDMSERFSYSYLSLADPYRIVIDLPEVAFDVGNNDHAGEGEGLVGQYRYGLFQAGTSRIVLDLTEPASVDKVFILPPSGDNSYRLVFDLKTTTAAGFRTAMTNERKSTRQPTAPTRRPTVTPPQRADGKRVIIIDAGHGGIDPGNLGSIGVPEKTIVLKIAQAIRDKLAQNPDYDVRMTRDRDIFIQLEERAEIARRMQADLFISVHADSFRQSSVRGGTIYTLSERASDRESELLARKENRSDLIAGIDLRGETDEVTSILIDLAQRETMNYSARFANLLLPELSSQIRMRTNSHRFAAFQVLKAPDVPSILLEAGYLTNRDDARNLNSSAGRRKIANAMKRGVDAYFAALKAEGY